LRRPKTPFLWAIGAWVVLSVAAHAAADLIGTVHGYVTQTVRKQYPAVVAEDISVKVQEGYTVPVLRGGATAEVIPPTRSGRLSGYMRIPVRVVSNTGQVILTEEVPVFISVRRPVVVTVHTFKSGMVVGPSDIRTTKMDVASTPENAFSNPKQILGLQVISDLAADTVLTPWMVRAVPVVTKGQPVVLLVQNGNVELELKAIALQDGALGEKIRVRTASSQKELTGEVLNEKTVKIRSGR
jgi:flagella basal body P-ring formation protein FlgA